MNPDQIKALMEKANGLTRAEIGNEFEKVCSTLLEAIETIQKLQKYVAFNGDTWVQDECNDFLKKVGSK